MSVLLENPTQADWDSPPGNRRALQHIDEILTVAPVLRGSTYVATPPPTAGRVEPAPISFGTSAGQPGG